MKSRQGVLEHDRQESALHSTCSGSMLLEQVFSPTAHCRGFAYTLAAIQILRNYRYPSDIYSAE